jgi:hypothetical protein
VVGPRVVLSAVDAAAAVLSTAAAAVAVEGVVEEAVSSVAD